MAGTHFQECRPTNRSEDCLIHTQLLLTIDNSRTKLAGFYHVYKYFLLKNLMSPQNGGISLFKSGSVPYFNDFMIELTRDELSRCQIGTLNIKRGQNINSTPSALHLQNSKPSHLRRIPANPSASYNQKTMTIRNK